MTEPRIGNLDELTQTDYDQPPLISWKDFYGFRNEVLHVLRRFGSAGPMGEVDLTVEDEDRAPAFAHEIVNDPDLFVVDDMYNEHDRLSLVECDPIHLTLEMLHAVASLAWKHQGWAVKFSMGDSGLLAGSDAILVGGRRFWDVDSLEQVAARCARAVDYGSPTPLLETQYQFWEGMICGVLKPRTDDPGERDRQWIEAEHTLLLSIERSPSRSLSTFDYDEVRYDLHPETRRQLIKRLLDEPHTLSAIISAGAVRNVERDVADALTNSPAPEQAGLARQVSTARDALRRIADTKEAFLWWPNILSRLRGADSFLRHVLIEELFTLSAGSDGSTQLSSLFSLAMLRLDGLASLIDESLKDHRDWAENEPLMKWLTRLKRGYAGYPDREVFVKLGLDGFVVAS